MSAPKLCIYEAVHSQRRESLVLLTSLAQDAVEALLRERPPTEARAWGGTGFVLEQIARNMPPEDADEFAAAFLPTLQGAGWSARVVRC